MNLNEFIENSQKIHNNKYDYSLVDYINYNTKVKIICPIHGIFEQIPKSHLKGCNCKKCHDLNKLTTIEDLLIKFNKIQNDKYDYSLMIFNGTSQKIKIICPIHGVFEQRVSYHLIGGGCSKCSKFLTEKEYISKAIKKHGDKYYL